MRCPNFLIYLYKNTADTPTCSRIIHVIHIVNANCTTMCNVRSRELPARSEATRYSTIYIYKYTLLARVGVVVAAYTRDGLHERVRYIDIYVYTFIDRYLSYSRAVMIKYSVLSSDRIVCNCASCLH